MVVDLAVCGVGARSFSGSAVGAMFNGRNVTAVGLRGRPAVVARDVGVALGYSQDGTGLVKCIGDEWAGEFEVGKHFEIVKGHDLAGLKQLVRQYRTSQDTGLGARSASCMLLYEPGIDLVLLKTDKPEGAKLRAFLVDEVLPKLRRGAASNPPDALVPVAPEPQVPDDAVAVSADDLLRAMGAVGASANQPVMEGIRGLQAAAHATLGLVRHLASRPVTDARGRQALPAPDDATLRAELAEAKAEAERLRAEVARRDLAAMRAKVRHDKAVAALTEAVDEKDRAFATLTAEWREQTGKIAALEAERDDLRVEREERLKKNEELKAYLRQMWEEMRVEFKKMEADLAVLTPLRLDGWWSPSRIAALLGEGITPEQVGEAVSRIPELRRRGDIEGMCRSVPYRYFHKGETREGVRFEYSVAAVALIGAKVREGAL